MTEAGFDDAGMLGGLPRFGGYPSLPPCLIYGLIGHGGMGSVYVARHLRLDMDVAVKCLHAEIAVRAESWVQRFRREAGLAARVSHQNLVRAFDVLNEHGLNYIVMELVRGENLRQLVQRVGPLPIDEAVAVIAQAAAGLAAAHAAGIVHRDIKPDNVLLSMEGVVKVADLGLAKALEPVSSELEGTLHTTTMGTPQYMSPEQWEDMGAVGPTTDVYALGATLWFLLAGRDGRRKSGLASLRRQALDEPFPDVREVRRDVPHALAALITKATAPDPRDRRPDGQAFLDDLRAIASPERRVGLRPVEVSGQLVERRPPSKVLRAAIDGGGLGELGRPSDTSPSPTDPIRTRRHPLNRPEHKVAGRPNRRRLAIALALVAVPLVMLAGYVREMMRVDERPDRIPVHGRMPEDPRATEVRQRLDELVEVSWEWVSVPEAIADIQARTGVPIRLDFEEQTGADLESPPTRLAIFGSLPADELLDAICTAGAGLGIEGWRVSATGVEVGRREIAEIRIYDTRPLTPRIDYVRSHSEETHDRSASRSPNQSTTTIPSAIPTVFSSHIERMTLVETEEILNLIREYIEPNGWDTWDDCWIDLADNGHLHVRHVGRVHEMVESLLNRMLHMDHEREWSIVHDGWNRLDVSVDPRALDGLSTAEAARTLAKQAGVACQFLLTDERLTDLPRTVVIGSTPILTVLDACRAIEDSTQLSLSWYEDRLIVADSAQVLPPLPLVIHDISWVDFPYGMKPSYVQAPDGLWVYRTDDVHPHEDAARLVSADTLAGIIEVSVLPSSWGASPMYSLSPTGPWLFVRTSFSAHKEIDRLLAAYKAAQADALPR